MCQDEEGREIFQESLDLLLPGSSIAEFAPPKPAPPQSKVKDSNNRARFFQTQHTLPTVPALAPNFMLPSTTGTKGQSAFSFLRDRGFSTEQIKTMRKKAPAVEIEFDSSDEEEAETSITWLNGRLSSDHVHRIPDTKKNTNCWFWWCKFCYRTARQKQIQRFLKNLTALFILAHVLIIKF